MSPDGLDGVVDAEVLVVLGDELDEAAFGSSKRMKFSTRSSSRAGSQVPRSIVSSETTPCFALAVDPLPLGEVLPARR